MHTANSTKWLSPNAISDNLLPKSSKNWLLDRGSMTKSLKKHCHELKVHLLSQAMQKPTLSESLYLGLHPASMALVREVYLKCDGEIVSFGRCIFPLSFFQGKNRDFLACLGTRPLGELLFRRHCITRKNLQIAHLFPDQTEYQQATIHMTTSTNTLWGRRSLLHFPGGKIMVMDILFPELEKFHV